MPFGASPAANVGTTASTDNMMVTLVIVVTIRFIITSLNQLSHHYGYRVNRNMPPNDSRKHGLRIMIVSALWAVAPVIIGALSSRSLSAFRMGFHFDGSSSIADFERQTLPSGLFGIAVGSVMFARAPTQQDLTEDLVTGASTPTSGNSEFSSESTVASGSASTSTTNPAGSLLVSGKTLAISGVLLIFGPFALGMILGSLPIAANDSGEGLGSIAWFTFFTAPLGAIALIAGLALLAIGTVRRSKKLPRLDSNQQPLD